MADEKTKEQLLDEKILSLEGALKALKTENEQLKKDLTDERNKLKEIRIDALAKEYVKPQKKEKEEEIVFDFK